LRVGFFRRRDGVGEVGDEEKEEGGDDEGFVAVSEELEDEGLLVKEVGEEGADGICMTRRDGEQGQLVEERG
jgi:hypothetical protein